MCIMHPNRAFHVKAVPVLFLKGHAVVIINNIGRQQHSMGLSNPTREYPGIAKFTD